MWVRVSFDRQKGKWIVLLLLLLATEKMPTMLIIFDHIFLLLLLLVALFCGAYGRFRFVPARNSASQEHVQLVWETLSWKRKRNEFFIDTRFDGVGGRGRHFDGLRLAGRSGTAVARSLLQQQQETGRPSYRSHPTLEKRHTHTKTLLLGSKIAKNPSSHAKWLYGGTFDVFSFFANEFVFWILCWSLILRVIVT